MKQSKLFQILMMLLFATALALGGCSGDDGDVGPKGDKGEQGDKGDKGDKGDPGEDGEDGEDGSSTADEIGTAITEDAVVSNVVATLDGTDLEITFNVKVNGVNRNDFTTARRAYVYYEDPALAGRALTAIERSNNVRTTIATAVSGTTVTTPMTLVSNGSGNYTITIPANSGNTAVPASSVPYVFDDSVYLFQLSLGLEEDEDLRPIVIAERGEPPLRDVVANDGCATCHGDYVFDNNNHYTVAAEYCQVCHTRDGRSFVLNIPNGDGTYNNTTNVGDGGNLPIYVHGIHNSHSMADEQWVRSVDNVTKIPAEENIFSIGYPSNLRNCVTCHVTEEQLAEANEAPVSFYLCMSCHQDWDGFKRISGGALVFAEGAANFPSQHRAFGIGTDCTICHSELGGIAPDKVTQADFHNSFPPVLTGTLNVAANAASSFYNGQDISFANPNEVRFDIAGVSVGEGGAVTFTWTAKKAGVAVDPCNSDIATGPTFRNLVAYLAYPKGDDWVNEGVGAAQLANDGSSSPTGPGQPLSSRNVFGTGGSGGNPNPVATTCAANVATTTGLVISGLAPEDTEVVMLALSYKPQDRIDGNTYVVRVPSRTYAFNINDGSAATPRRDIVDNAKCLGCHQGTLYQHGGDRVDNVQLCVMCHNPASSEKNRRVDIGITADNSYDGKSGQSFDMRTMIHAIHSAGETDEPYVVYRTNGIYAFVGSESELNDWPTGDFTCKTSGSLPANNGYIVANSSPATCRVHNKHEIHFPEKLNDCEVCHKPGTYEIADQTKAVALTVDAGVAPWADQSDDMVIGPNAAACTSCHSSGPVRAHAEVFGYKAVVTKDAMLEAEQESCEVCHGGDIAEVHGN